MLEHKFKQKNIILASGSPRQDLFKELDVNFTIQVKDVAETYSAKLKGEEITNYLAKLKAAAFENEILKTI